jgi:dUTP pyrophosphatase
MALLVNIVNKSKNQLPEYQTTYSAGMDLCADLKESLLLRKGERKLVPSGLYIELMQGYEAQVRPRSGLALNHGVTVLNAPGTIDADYRGEIKVLLINLGEEDYILKPGDRMAQLVVAKHETIHWQQADELSETQRGSGGYGHTGN